MFHTIEKTPMRTIAETDTTTWRTAPRTTIEIPKATNATRTAVRSPSQRVSRTVRSPPPIAPTANEAMTSPYVERGRCDEVHDRDSSGERAQDAVLGQVVQAFGEKLQRRRSAFDRHGLRIPASQPDGDRGTAGVRQPCQTEGGGWPEDEQNRTDDRSEEVAGDSERHLGQGVGALELAGRYELGEDRCLSLIHISEPTRPY